MWGGWKSVNVQKSPSLALSHFDLCRYRHINYAHSLAISIGRMKKTFAHVASAAAFEVNARTFLLHELMWTRKIIFGHSTKPHSSLICCQIYSAHAEFISYDKKRTRNIKVQPTPYIWWRSGINIKYTQQRRFSPGSRIKIFINMDHDVMTPFTQVSNGDPLKTNHAPPG